MIRKIEDMYVSVGNEIGALVIPVGLAFFFGNSQLGRTVAFYPGPAGVIIADANAHSNTPEPTEPVSPPVWAKTPTINTRATPFTP